MKKDHVRSASFVDTDYEDDAKSDVNSDDDSLRSDQIPSSSDKTENEKNVSSGDDQPYSDKEENDKKEDVIYPPVPRGPTVGKKQMKKATKQSGKIKVEYNKLGMIVGDVADDIATVCGVLARTSIPITYNDWRIVPEETKQRLWELLNFQYDLLPRSKKDILKSVGTSFRNFKYYLKLNYIIPNRNNKKLLYMPPAKYPSITKEEWRMFVNNRLSESFKRISDTKKEHRSRNNMNHKLSRKGYRGVIQQVCSELGVSEVDIDRCELWKRAYVDKEGRMEPSVMEIVQLIEKYQKQFKEGTLKTKGKMDILAMALGKEPRRGHLQGTGKYLSASKYYHFFTENQYNQENRTSSRSTWESLIEEKMKDLQDLIQTTRLSFLDEGSSSVAHRNIPEYNAREKEMVGEAVAGDGGEEPGPRKDMDQEKKGIKKRKKVGGKKVEKISSRDLPSRKSPRLNPHNKDHNIQNENLSEGPNIKAVEGKAKKALDFDEITRIDLKKNEKKDKQVKLPQQSVRRTRGASVQYQQTTNVLKMFAVLVESRFVDKDQTIQYLMDDAVFGMACKSFVSKLDCQKLLKMEWAESSHIETYSAMMFMSERNVWIRDPIRNVEVPMFSFIHSVRVYPKKAGIFAKPNYPVDKRATDLVQKRLIHTSNGQFLFMVYNPINHWVLVVIEVSTKKVFYLDPMNNLPNPDLKDLINLSMTIFAAQHGFDKKWVYETMVTNVKVPRQPGSNECGYYVMRYIRDIMEDINVLNNNFNGKEVYLQSEIDEVRDEWALQITSLLDRE